MTNSWRFFWGGLFLTIAILCGGLTTTSHAQEAAPPPAPEVPGAEAAPEAKAAPPPPPSVKWNASAELGFVLTTGNTKSNTINGAVDGSLGHGDWTHKAKGSVLFTRQDDPATPTGAETTARKFEASGKTNYDISKRQYLYATVRYENDKFSGFKYRVTESAGYGIRIIATDDVKLDVEGGPAGRHSKTPASAGPPVTAADTQNDFGGRGALHFEWKMSPTASLTEDASTTYAPDGSGGWVTESTSALTAKVVGGLALKAAFNIQHVSDLSAAPAGTKDVDTKTTLTLVYSFGSEEKDK